MLRSLGVRDHGLQGAAPPEGGMGTVPLLSGLWKCIGLSSAPAFSRSRGSGGWQSSFFIPYCFSSRTLAGRAQEAQSARVMQMLDGGFREHRCMACSPGVLESEEKAARGAGPGRSCFLGAQLDAGNCFFMMFFICLVTKTLDLDLPLLNESSLMI